MKKLDEGYWVTTSDNGKYSVVKEEEVYSVYKKEDIVTFFIDKCLTYRSAIKKIEEEQEKDKLSKRSITSKKVIEGVDIELEAAADRILMEDRSGITKHSEKNDILLGQQLDRRRSREILPSAGFPEREIVSGMYNRAYNPLLRRQDRNE